MTAYQKALKLAYDQDYGELYEFLVGKVTHEQLLHIYAIAQAELALEVNNSNAQFDIVNTIQTHIIK